MADRPVPDTVWDEAQSHVLDLDPSASGVVIGAPGVGKTRVAIERARRLIDDVGMGADEILILTPSRLTATQIRDVLGVQTTVATPGALARSIGSFAFQIVRAATVRANLPAPQLLTGADQDRLVAELLAGDDQDEVDGSPRWPADELPRAARGSEAFRSELRSFLAECTQLSVDADELEQVAHRVQKPVWSAIASFMRDYRGVLGAMRSAHRESAELISEAAELICSTSQEQDGAMNLRVVIIDDAQELTRGGVDLIRALRSRGVAVLAFGDPDISSGSFRGATPQLFAELVGDLGDVHVLDVAHRQTPALLHVTRAVTQAIGAAGRVEHRRAPGPTPDSGGVIVRLADSPFAEVDVIARTLREWHLLSGVPWSNMAVLAHDTRQVSALATELAAREVPTRAAGIQRPLGQESAVRDILRVIELVMKEPEQWEGESVASVLLSPFGGLDAVGLRRLRARLRHRELATSGTTSAPALLAAALAAPLELTFIDTPEARIALRLATTLGEARTAYLRGDTIHDLLWLVWEKAQLFGRPLAEVWREQSAGAGAAAAEASANLDALVALFDAAKRSVERAPDAAPIAFIQELIGSDVPEDSLATPATAGTVTLMTPATALGTEFDAVVIAGVQEGVWPNVRLRGTLLDTYLLGEVVDAAREGESALVSATSTDRRRTALHDELRLFVRALSRARTNIVVTAVNDDDYGPSALFSFLPDPTPPSIEDEHPLTLRGLVARLRRTLTCGSAPQEAQEAAAAQLALLADQGVTGAAPADWYGVTEQTSTGPLRDSERAPVSVSPSRLEGLEACAVDWAVRALGGDSKTWSQGLGTILHAAMEEVPSGDVGELERVVAERWGELEFEADWLSDKERRWATTLIERISAYIRNVASHEGVVVGAETMFELVVPADATSVADIYPRNPDTEVVLPAALVRGAIDRVERYPAGRGELVPINTPAPHKDRVVIVDLKTGRSESRVSDDKVKADAQLAAYQLAVGSGALADVDPLSGAGARLVVISQELVSKKMRYRIAHQPPQTPEQQSEFIQRIVEGAKHMASSSFTANIDTHCNHERFAVCRIHTIGPVSAS